jgi:hypothetical protein
MHLLSLRASTRMGAKAMKIIRDLTIFRPASLRRSINVALNVCVSPRTLVIKEKRMFLGLVIMTDIVLLFEDGVLLFTIK